jgi:hypothetical protein
MTEENQSGSGNTATQLSRAAKLSVLLTGAVTASSELIATLRESSVAFLLMCSLTIALVIAIHLLAREIEDGIS